MAYADYEFYTKSFFGNVVPESDFNRVSERASDFVDTLTHDRLIEQFPTSEKAQNRIKKAVCALAEVVYQFDLAQQNAVSASAKGATVTAGDEVSTGVITSKSSGSESVSYATPQQLGSSAKEWSAVYAVAGDSAKMNDLLMATAVPLLMGIRTDEGIPILYAGL